MLGQLTHYQAQAARYVMTQNVSTKTARVLFALGPEVLGLDGEFHVSKLERVVETIRVMQDHAIERAAALCRLPTEAA